MKGIIINIMYSVLFVPLATLRILCKSYKNPKYLARFNERLAWYRKSSEIHKVNNPVWFHTVSVGEFLGAKALITVIAANNSDVLITTTTPTGSNLVRHFIDDLNKNGNHGVYHVYYPYDSTKICERFLNLIKPKIAIFFETEIWPRMFDQIKKSKIKLYIINARLSEKSFNGYVKIPDLIRKSLNNVDYIATQSIDDASRFKTLGYSNQIDNFGNIKYNITLPEDIDSKSKQLKVLFGNQDAKNNVILIAASTHADEEEKILKIYRNLKVKFKNLKLILVPRHPERFNQVYSLCLKNNFNITRYTSHKDFNDHDDNFDIFLLDTLGKLMYFYNISDLAFIGGSLVDVGGHNPLEPVMLKVPCIIGPYYYNFKDIVSNLKQTDAIVIANDEITLEKEIEALLDNSEQRSKIACAAYHNIMQQQGVLQKYYKLISNAIV